MAKKMMFVAACAAAMLLGGGIAHADPAPDPNGPKCWVTNNEGHQELTPCGWAYSDSQGWYEVPKGFQAIS